MRRCTWLLLLAVLPSTLTHADDAARARGKALQKALTTIDARHLGTRVIGLMYQGAQIGRLTYLVTRETGGRTPAYKVVLTGKVELGETHNTTHTTTIVGADLSLRRLSATETESGPPAQKRINTLTPTARGFTQQYREETDGKAPLTRKADLPLERGAVLDALELAFPAVLLTLTPGQPVELRALRPDGRVVAYTFLRQADEGDVARVRITRGQEQGIALLDRRTGALRRVVLPGQPIELKVVSMTPATPEK